MIRIFKFRPDGGLNYEEQPNERLLILGPEELLWLDLENPTAEEAALLKSGFQLHPLVLEDILVENQHPKIDVYPEYLFLVLHGINYQAATQHFATAEINVVLGQRFLISHHEHQMRSVNFARERILKDPMIFTQGLDYLIHSILDRMIDNFFPEMEKLEERITELEQEVFAKPSNSTLNRIFGLKRDLLHLKRIVVPQREVFNRLSRDEIAWIRPSTRLYFRDTYDSLYRMSEIVDSYRDLLTGLIDAYLSVVSNNLNQVMKVLTVIATVCIPMTVITGVYGMNFENMPELEWRFGYYFALGLMGLVGIGMLLYFRKKKWV